MQPTHDEKQIMEKAEIIERINNFLVEEFELDEEQLVPEARLKEDLDIESLDFVDIAVIVEREFDFKMKSEDMTHLRLLSELYDYITANVA